jgi:hypothetical protein
MAMSAASLSMANPSEAHKPSDGSVAAAWASPVPSTGINTSTTTVMTSSTSSQPTATWPCGELSTSASISTRISTTVLATANAMPSTAPAAKGNPRAVNTAVPSSVATRL